MVLSKGSLVVLQYQALTNRVGARVKYLKPKKLQIVVLDYFLTSTLTNTLFQFPEYVKQFSSPQVSPSERNCIICFIESPFINDKESFLFHLKSPCHSQDVSVFIMTFGHVKKAA